MKANSEKKAKSRLRQAVLILLVVAVTVVPILTFIIFTGKMVDDITSTISLQYSEELNSQMSAHISSTLDYYFHQMNTEYNALRLFDDIDEQKLQSFIAESQESNSISYLAYADEDGMVYEADGSYLGTMRISIIGRLLNGEKRVVADNVTIGNESLILLGTSFDEPVSMGGKSLSIVMLGLNNNDLQAHLRLESNYSGGFSSIIHTDGSYVIKNSKQEAPGLNAFAILGKSYKVSGEEIAAVKEAVKNGETYMCAATSDGVINSVYLYFAPIEGTQWYIINNLPCSFIKSSVEQLRSTLSKVYIVFAALFLLIAAAVVFQQTLIAKKLSKAKNQLEDALDYAEQASNAKTAFLFNMSHDIRTPMNAILGYTDIGLRHMDSEELTRDSFVKIKTAGGHLLSLINDILEMSRIESGKMSINEKPIDIRKAVADVTTMSKSLAIAKSMNFRVEMGEIKNPYIYADELHINEVIINIISNAVKYTPEEGNVTYTITQLTDAADGRVTFRFEVADNGIGMSKEFQEHLFESFSREQNTTMSKIEGTGLGLSIVKKIVDLFGGEIRVHSVQGEGSVFTVEVPFRVMDEEAIKEFTAGKEEVTAVPVLTDFTGRRVLLTEDNEMNREIATELLEEAGLEVDVAEDGEIALRAVMEKGVEYYDFILMDIQMPVMNGYEATKRIRELQDGDRVPIIALSANAFEEDRKKSIENGMNAHVAKPIDVKLLFETIQGIVR